jgi:hypothetical protein
VAGYVKDGPDGHELKHLVINGGFNPGNSGGPLVRKLDNHVIGIVVAKARIYPPHIKKLIDTLNAQMSGVVYPGTDGKGRRSQFSEAQIVGAVLEQFHNTTK